MFNRLAITKLKAILVIDLIIVALAAGGYFYVQSSFERPKSVAFVLSDLTISPAEVEVGQQVTISVNVTNIGTAAGGYSANLAIDDVPSQNQTVQLSGAESTIVNFVIDGAAEGNHSVKIGELAGSFVVKAPPPPPVSGGGETKPANLGIYSLKISPNEGWPGAAMSITAEARNSGDLAASASVDLYVDNALVDTKEVKVPAGITVLVRFSWIPQSEGPHSIRMTMSGYTLTGTVKVVPTGTHTLSVNIYPSGNAKFTVDGQGFTTPYSGTFNEGIHTVAIEAADPTGTNLFLRWEDGSTDPTRRISLTSAMSLTAYFTGGASSCPSLYIWNGNSYVYTADVSDHGWLGYINYINEDGSITFWRNNPWDYIPLDKSQLQPNNNGYYDMTLTQRWDEIFYLDSAYMLIVDHPSDVNVYSTMVEQYLDPNYMGQIYTVSKNPLTPISAVNEKGENVLPEISMIDGIFTPGINGLNSPSWDNISWNRLTLNLGDLSNAKQIKLVVRGIVDFGSGDDYNTWLNKFFAQPVPNGTQITPPPYMEVKDANGNWVSVPDGRQFPIPPDAVPRTFVVDLTGLFPTNDYSLRINNFWNVTFDYIGVDTTSPENVTIYKIYPYATLYQAFNTNSSVSGNFTRYGDVSKLVLNEDDEFVIGKQGDAVSLQFPVPTTPLQANMERDYFFYDALWFKDKNGNWGFGFGFTVDPLPFHDMSGFPYPLTESYPYDAAHLSYLQEYNTRVINPP
jgi:plasmid maintenance system killer protein